MLFHGGEAGEARSASGRRIAGNMGLQLGARVITMAISAVTVSLTARTLDPGGYGVLNGMGSFVGLFGALTDLGFVNVISQRMAAEPERESEWLGALFTVRTSLAIAACAICAATVPLLSNAHNGHVVGWVTTLTLLSTGPQALMAVFSTRLREGVILSFSVLQSFLWVGIVIGLALAHGNAVEFAAANVAVIALIGVLQLRTTRRFAVIAWREGRRLWRSVLRVALPIGIASAFIVIYVQIDSVLLLQIKGPHEAGIYSAAYQFLSPLIFLPATVMGSIFPVVAAVYGEDPARARRLVQIGADLMAVIALPILAGAIALTTPIIHLLYGAEFHRTAGLLPILMIAFVSICYGSLAGYLAPVLGLQWRLALFSGIGMVVNVVSNLLLIPHFGAYGAAWVTVATEVLTMVLMLSTTLRRLQLKLAPGKIVRTVAVTAAMTGVMTLARPLGLLPAGTIGVLFYAIGLLVARIIDGREALVLVRGRPA